MPEKLLCTTLVDKEGGKSVDWRFEGMDIKTRERPINTEKTDMLSTSHQKQIFSQINKLTFLAGFFLILAGCNWYIPYEDEYDGLSALAQGGVIEATGYSVIQSHSGSEPQQRLMAIKAARLDAFRQLAEIVYGTYIDSNTTISDLTIQDDVYRARVEGVIYGAELVKIEPISNDTYAVTLGLPRAMVNDLRLLYMRLVSSN